MPFYQQPIIDQILQYFDYFWENLYYMGNIKKSTSTKEH